MYVLEIFKLLKCWTLLLSLLPSAALRSFEKLLHRFRDDFVD
jgi:hypothetical protein